MEVKPPLGIMPKKLWIKKRKQELEEALVRYITSDELIPSEWVDELNEYKCSNDKKIGFAIMNEHYEYLYKVGEQRSGCYSSSPIDMLSFDSEVDAYKVMEKLIEQTALVCVYI